MNEKLSAFVDNELSELEERRLVADLAYDAELRAAWERYHLIGAVMRNELESIAPANLPGAVAAAIAREPLQAKKISRTMIAKAVGGLAVAASVAVVAVLSLQSSVAPLSQESSVAQLPTTSQSARTTNAAVPIPVRVPTAADTLNAYLVEHNEFAPTAGMGHMLPYVRSVNHDNKQ